MTQTGDEIFSADGYLATGSRFWTAYKATAGWEDGITPELKRMVGELAVLPTKEFPTPFSAGVSRGRALNYGAEWMEAVLTPPTAKGFKPKATAEDAFGFYESGANIALYEQSVSGWIPVSVPTDFEGAQQFLDGGGYAGYINGIVKQARSKYNIVLEDDIAKKLVSCIPAANKITADDGQGGLRDAIRGAVSTIRGRGDAYLVGPADEYGGAKIMNRISGCRCYMEESTYNTMIGDLPSLPSPDRIVSNVPITVIPDGHMPTPVTASEMAAGRGSGGPGWAEGNPGGMDEGKPAAVIWSDNYAEYRPYRAGVKVNRTFNGAGDYEDYHVIWRGSLGIRPWEKAARVYIGAGGAGGGGQ